jgi:ABC-type amino acid transport substrate-binding protein
MATPTRRTVVGFALGAGLAGAARARPLDDVVAANELRVILYDENEPFSWTEGGEVGGIEVDLARALAAKLGVGVRIDLRMQGERLDQDLRTNLIRGTFGGGIVGDVMLHVPVDRTYVRERVEGVFVVNAYFQQRVALGLTRRFEGPSDVASFDAFRTRKIAVQLGTVADYFLMRLDGGALIDTVVHYVRPHQIVPRLVSGEVTAVLGVQSSLEALLAPHAGDLAMRWSTPPMPGLTTGSWSLGMGFFEPSKDLSYALGRAMRDLRTDGTVAAITARYGVSYVPPDKP